MERVLLLMTATTYKASAFLEAARELGLAVTVVTDRPQVLASLHPSGNLACSFVDPEAGARAIAEHARGHPVLAILATDDEGVILAARASALLGLPHSPVDAVAAARNKLRTRELLAACGLNVPAFHPVRVDGDPAEASRAVGFPCVVKPLSLAASRGVMRANDPAQLDAALRRLSAILKNGTRRRAACEPPPGEPDSIDSADVTGRDTPDSLRPSPAPSFAVPSPLAPRRPTDDDGGGPPPARQRPPGDHLRDDEPIDRPPGGEPDALIESYIFGDEVAVEGLLTAGALDVLAIFDKPDPLEGPFFEETIYVTPSRHTAADQEAIVLEIRKAVAALGLREGPVHAEARVNERGAFVVEIAPRSIGGLCSRALRFDGGRSLERLLLEHALGRPVRSIARERRAAGVMMIPIPRRGVLRRVAGAEEALAVPGIEDLRISIPIGQEIVPLPEGSRYLGFIFSRASEPVEAEAALREAHRRLRFDIQPAAPGDLAGGRVPE